MDVLSPAPRAEALCVCVPRAATPPPGAVPPVFLRLLLAGALEPVEYAGLLVQYREVYAALDRAAAAHPAEDPLSRRLRAGIRAGLEDLESDLAVLLGSGRTEPAVLPATRVYIERIHAAAAAGVEGLIAHRLVRYDADRLGAGLIQLALYQAYGPLAARLAFHAVARNGAARTPRTLPGLRESAAWTHARCESVAAEAAVAAACDRELLAALGAALARP